MKNNRNQNQNQNNQPDYLEKTPIIRDCRDIPLLCTRCKSLLAFVDAETKSEIRVKNRDLYISCIDPAQFTISCRSCGSINTVHRVQDTEES